MNRQTNLHVNASQTLHFQELDKRKREAEEKLAAMKKLEEEIAALKKKAGK